MRHGICLPLLFSSPFPYNTVWSNGGGAGPHPRRTRACVGRRAGGSTGKTWRRRSFLLRSSCLPSRACLGTPSWLILHHPKSRLPTSLILYPVIALALQSSHEPAPQLPKNSKPPNGERRHRRDLGQMPAVGRVDAHAAGGTRRLAELLMAMAHRLRFSRLASRRRPCSH